MSYNFVPPYDGVCAKDICDIPYEYPIDNGAKDLYLKDSDETMFNIQEDTGEYFKIGESLIENVYKIFLECAICFYSYYFLTRIVNELHLFRRVLTLLTQIVVQILKLFFHLILFLLSFYI